MATPTSHWLRLLPPRVDDALHGRGCERGFHRLTLDAAQAVQIASVEEPVAFAGVVERQDMRMVEIGGDLDFTEKPIQAEGRTNGPHVIGTRAHRGRNGVISDG